MGLMMSIRFSIDELCVMKDMCVFLRVISDRMIAEGLRPDESNSNVAKVMTWD